MQAIAGFGIALDAGHRHRWQGGPCGRPAEAGRSRAMAVKLKTEPAKQARPSLPVDETTTGNMESKEMETKYVSAQPNRIMLHAAAI